jgi:SOS regulatory protein LexA
MVKMETLSNRIRRLREEKGLKQKDVAAILSVNPNTYCRYENGERTPPPGVIAKLAEIFGVTSDYLLGRNGIKQAEGVPAVPNAFPISGYIQIPVYGVIRAGDPIYAEENIIGFVSLPEEELRGDNYFGLKVTGDSMKDAGIFDGSTVVVRRQPVVDNGRIAVVLLKERGEATVKRFYSKNGTIILKPENSDYEPQIYKPKDIMVLGEAVRVINKL